MPKFRQVAEILRLMSQKDRVRNVGVIAHIDHGKTTMTDSLLIEAGLLPPQVAGAARVLDYLEEEQRRGITIKTANISLLHEMNGKSYVINLVDTPGHVDFTGKVTRALRAIDGAVVVVDVVEEIMAQTETVTRQALQERVRPVLFINKIDRLITELRLSTGDIQKKLTRITDDFNNLIETHAESEFRKKWRVDPTRETVAFGSALHKWGLTLNMAKREGIKFTDILDAYKKRKHQALSKQFPLYNAILDMVVNDCPSPVEAQEYRIPRIWKGKLDSEVGRTMMNCDADGPAVACVTSVQSDQVVGMVVTGRLFAGSVKEGSLVYLVNAGRECRITQVCMFMGAFREKVDQISAGNIAALAGLDQARAGEMIVDAAYRETVPFEQMKYVSEPVMTIVVEPKDPRDLPRLDEALRRVAVEDPNLVVSINERTGERLLSGMGELHLETAVNFLRAYAGEMEVTTTKPTADYRETVTAKGLAVTARSSNKRNSFRVQVEPCRGRIPQPSPRARTGRTWASDDSGNELVDLSRGDSCLDEAKDMIVQGFRWACKTGPLSEQPLRNVRAELLDAQVHEDSCMRELTQIVRTMSRAVLGSFLTAKPKLLEPIYRLEVSTPIRWFGSCTKIITSRRGKIQITQSRGDLTIIVGYIPVAETFGLTAEFRSATSGNAFWQSDFDHWESVPDDVSARVISQIRARRGLPAEIPKPDKFIDEA